jgi:hypothetical protein
MNEAAIKPVRAMENVTPSNSDASRRRSVDDFEIASLADLVALPAKSAGPLDIAHVNLLCAQGLPGAENLDVPACLATVDRWARGVKRFTSVNRQLYYEKPHEYEHHQGLFRFLMMANFLKHPNGVGVRYQPTAIGNCYFRDSRDDFLHGLLTRRLGTCASLPVLAVAIGRRLGYPMYLAISKGHTFCQWVDDRGGRINLELSCPRGGDTMSDKSLEQGEGWKRMTAADKATGRYLRPLKPNEELALFLGFRGHCLCDNHRFDEARRAYGQAEAIAPGFTPYEANLRAVDMDECGTKPVWYRTTVTVMPNHVRGPCVTDAMIPKTHLFPTLYTLPGYTTGLIDR